MLEAIVQEMHLRPESLFREKSRIIATFAHDDRNSQLSRDEQRFVAEFGGFSRLNIPTQDFVYRPLLYSAWRHLVELRRARRQQTRRQVELAHLARGKSKTSEIAQKDQKEREKEMTPSS